MMRVERDENARRKPVEAPRKPVKRLGVSKSALEVRDLLVAVRKARGLRALDVSQTLHVTRSAVSAFESGKTPPRWESLQQYADAVGCRVVMVVDDLDPVADEEDSEVARRAGK